ncbi:MAG TPA: LPS export ABC transporter periplasmic protein LptC [Coxiellaceae bacterium]|nr:MAG: LPS export ABC transporter periplasmic protein LptC [Gammaproteobacteria bacterium RIFCSPHIGHO2_12_FULL_36_30]HLB56479.1 LPS export ABC transporter periplasmic protein LptC [Coxiellaceae bacterium]
MKHKVMNFYLILFVLLGVMSMVILHHTQKININSSQKTTVQTFVHDATFTEYNQTGLIKAKIHSEKIMHYEPQGTTLFKKPFIIVYTETRVPWHIRADQAVSDRTGKKLILTGNVIAHELPTAKNEETTVKTTEITVYPDPKEFRVETDQPVVLTRPGTKITGKGFSANLKTGRYRLHSAMKAVYLPQQKKHKSQ